MQLKELCLELAYAESSDEISKILEKHNLLEDKYWRSYGDMENNYGIIGNQSSSSDRALVEKIVNCQDAILSKENLIRKYSGSDYSPPPDMQTALKEFFNIDEGRLINLGSHDRGKLASNIMLVATGSKMSPTYTIIDNGEGQSPKSMPETIFSLVKSNKVRIPFVQGKYNQGGSGVVNFCENGYMFVLSKRCPKLAVHEEDSTNKSWGFSLVRRYTSTEGYKSSMYKYLVFDEIIPSFEEDQLALTPLAQPYPANVTPPNYVGNMEYGTFIKLYNYKAGTLRTTATLNLNKRLSLLLPQIGLPCRIFERRKGYKANTYHTTMSGLDVRLTEDKHDLILKEYIGSGEIDVEDQHIDYTFYPFKDKKATEYTDNDGVIFTFNGQTHPTLKRAFFKTRKVSLGVLANRMLVICDCSKFSIRAMENFVKTDRENFMNTEFKDKVINSLAEELKKHPGLIELQSKIKQEEIKKQLENSKPLADTLNTIIKKSPTLAKLFIQGQALNNPFNVKNVSDTKKYIGKKFPTFFTLIKKFPDDKPKNAEFGRKFKIKYKTDAENTYFKRNRDSGTMQIFLNDKEFRNFTRYCWNGTCNVTIDTSGYAIDEVLHFKSRVTDVEHLAQPFEEEFFVKIIPQQQERNGRNGSRTKPPGNTKGKKNKNQDNLSIPEIHLIKEDRWEEFGFDKYSVLDVKSGLNGYEFSINVDNIYLLNELKTAKSVDTELVESKFSFSIILMAIAMLKEVEENPEKDETKFQDDICHFMKLVAPVVLPMINNLGELDSEKEILEEF